MARVLRLWGSSSLSYRRSRPANRPADFRRLKADGLYAPIVALTYQGLGAQLFGVVGLTETRSAIPNLLPLAHGSCRASLT